MTALQELVGPCGRAVRCDVPSDAPNAAVTVCAWIVTAPAYHPLWAQYLLSVVSLADTAGVEPAKLQFDGATHELMVAALNPEHGPYRAKDIARLGASVLHPINIAEQFTATADEMVKLASLAAAGVINGTLNPETSDASDKIREGWLQSLVRTLAHLRGEEHERPGPRVEHRQHGFTQPRPGEQLEMRISPGITINDEQAINDMRRQTHDGLIAEVGDRRRSGISWKEFVGLAEVTAALDMLDAEPLRDEVPADAETAIRAASDQYRAFAAEHGNNAVLIVAMCEALV